MSGPVAGEVLRALTLHGPAQRKDLEKRLPGFLPRQISNGLYTLNRRELVILLGDRRWHLTADGESFGPAVMAPGVAGLSRSVRTSGRRTFRQRAWQALRRKSGKATIADLLRVLGSDTRRDANNLEGYFRALEAAGILTRLKWKATGVALTSPGHTIWVMNDDPGPKAPIWQSRKNQVFDPNTNTVIPLPPKGATP